MQEICGLDNKAEIKEMLKMLKRICSGSKERLSKFWVYLQKGLFQFKIWFLI